MNAVVRRSPHTIYIPIFSVFKLSWGLIASAVLLSAILATAFSVIYERDLHRQATGSLEMLHQQQHQLNLEAKQLLLEQSTWVTQARVQYIAETQLGMDIPDQRHVVIVRS